MRRKFDKQLKVLHVESRILEEGFWLLALGHQMAAYSSPIAIDLIPVLPPPVKRSGYSSESEANAALKEWKVAEKLVRDYSFFKSRLRSVEISWETQGIFKIYFALPTECEFLTEESKKSIIQELDFGDEDRVKFFVQKTSSIHDDIALQKALQNDLIFLFLLRFQDELDYATAGLAILINFILIISVQKNYFIGDSTSVYEPRYFKDITQGLVIAQLIVLLYKLLQTSILTLPLIYKESLRICSELIRIHKKIKRDVRFYWKELFQSFGHFIIFLIICFVISLLLYERYSHIHGALVAVQIIFLGYQFLRSLDTFSRSSLMSKIYAAPILMSFVQSCNHGELQYRVICAIVGIFALDVNRPYFCSLLLLCIVKLSITLQNVVKAVTLPRVALFLSALLGLIMIFIFAIFAFYFFPNEFYNQEQHFDECSTLLLCLTTFLHGGLLSGGGIADHISGELGHAPIFADQELVSLQD